MTFCIIFSLDSRHRGGLGFVRSHGNKIKTGPFCDHTYNGWGPGGKTQPLEETGNPNLVNKISLKFCKNVTFLGQFYVTLQMDLVKCKACGVFQFCFGRDVLPQNLKVDPYRYKYFKKGTPFIHKSTHFLAQTLSKITQFSQIL